MGKVAASFALLACTKPLESLIKLFDIDTNQLLQSATPNGGLDLQGLLATLSSEGAASLNQLLGTDAFTTGQPIGGLTVILPHPPGS